MTKLYLVRYFSRDHKTRELKFLGSAEVDDSNTSDVFPLAAKAFRHAPEPARHATRVEFEPINCRAK